MFGTGRLSLRPAMATFSCSPPHIRVVWPQKQSYSQDGLSNTVLSRYPGVVQGSQSWRRNLSKFTDMQGFEGRPEPDGPYLSR